MRTNKCAMVGSDMEFLQEDVRQVWPEAHELLIANHSETGMFQGYDFNPSCEKYGLLEDQGVARLFTARSKSILVGYEIFFIFPHLHYPDKVFALQDVLYVDPSHRGVGAVKFILWTDEELHEQGADVILRHVTTKVDYSRVLSRLGYEELETSFVRTRH